MEGGGWAAGRAKWGAEGGTHPGVMRFFAIHLARGLATAQTNISITPATTTVISVSKVMHVSPIWTMQRTSSTGMPKRGGICGGAPGGENGGTDGGGAGGGGKGGDGGGATGGGGGGRVRVTCSGVSSAV